MIDYKYNEQELVEELLEYVNTTYGGEAGGHYATGSIETTEYIIDQGLGQGFIIGNMIKYASRYGKKQGKNRKDLLKVLHYTLMSLYLHDLEVSNETNKEEQNAESKEETTREFIRRTLEGSNSSVRTTGRS